MGKTYVYIGNWWAKERPAKGIAVCRYDAETGRLTCLKNVHEELFVGGACLDQKRGVLYVTDERADYPDMRQGGGGQIVALAIDPETGDLTEISRSPSYGANPSYLEIDGGANYLLVANHGTRGTVTKTETDEHGKLHIKTVTDEASVVLFPLGEDGSIGEPVDLFRLTGEGPAIFQLGSHAHCVRRAPANNLYAVCDKGGDQVYMLKLDYQRKKLALCDGSPYHRTPGSAPRYCVFHPTLPYLYVNKEYKTIISIFRYDAQGRLEPVGSVSSLPEHIAPPEGASQSDLCIGSSGRRLYVLLRRVNVITVFDIDGQTGALTMIQTLEHVCDGGRGCAISPDGRFLIVASLSGDVTTYPIQADGTLSPAAAAVKQPVPGTVTFFEVN